MDCTAVIKMGVLIIHVKEERLLPTKKEVLAKNVLVIYIYVYIYTVYINQHQVKAHEQNCSARHRHSN